MELRSNFKKNKRKNPIIDCEFYELHFFSCL
nr:MAG TPA: hypothetical protein [Bacteriophage sp.]